MITKTYQPLTNFVPGPIEKKVLSKGKFVIVKGPDDKLMWLHVGKYCSIMEFDMDEIIDPKFYKVCTYTNDKQTALVIIDDNYSPFCKDLPEIGRRIHITTRNGMYLVTRHANGMFAITCNAWKQREDHPDEIWLYPRQFKCYAGGMEANVVHEIAERLPRESGYRREDESGEVVVHPPADQPPPDDLPF